MNKKTYIAFMLAVYFLFGVIVGIVIKPEPVREVEKIVVVPLEIQVPAKEDKPVVIEIPEPEPTMTFLGVFNCTAYSADYACCGKLPGDPAYGITASGTKATEGITIASDWDKLPVGTQVYIAGVGIRTVEDTGGAIKGDKIDLYFDEYKTAVNFGRQKLDVWILN